MNYDRLSRALGVAYVIASESSDAATDLRAGLRGNAAPGSPADMVQRIVQGDTPPLDEQSALREGLDLGADGTPWAVAAQATANYGNGLLADVSGPLADTSGWPNCASLATFYKSHWPARPWSAELPGDPGVIVGNVHAAQDHGCDAVVSLCRMGATQIEADAWRTIWMVDAAAESANPRLDFVVRDAVDLIAVLRAQDKSVYLHCVAGESRTPTIAAAYLRLHLGIPVKDTLAAYKAIKSTANPNKRFLTYLQKVES